MKIPFLTSSLDHCCSVCMKLHNLCLDRNLDNLLHCFSEDIRDSDDWVVHDNIHDEDDDLCGYPVGDQRRDINHKLQQLRIGRPLHAAMNSHCS